MEMRVLKALAELHSTAGWKAGFISDEPGSLAEEISKQNVEGVTWVFPVPYSKVQEERHNLWEELFNKKGTSMMIWKIHSLF